MYIIKIKLRGGISKEICDTNLGRLYTTAIHFINDRVITGIMVEYKR